MLHELWRLGTHRKLYAMVMLHLLHMQRIQIYVHEADKQLEFELITTQIIIGTNNIGVYWCPIIGIYCLLYNYCYISSNQCLHFWTNERLDKSISFQKFNKIIDIIKN